MAPRPIRYCATIRTGCLSSPLRELRRMNFRRDAYDGKTRHLSGRARAIRRGVGGWANLNAKDNSDQR